MRKAKTLKTLAFAGALATTLLLSSCASISSSVNNFLKIAKYAPVTKPVTAEDFKANYEAGVTDQCKVTKVLSGNTVECTSSSQAGATRIITIARTTTDKVPNQELALQRATQLLNGKTLYLWNQGYASTFDGKPATTIHALMQKDDGKFYNVNYELIYYTAIPTATPWPKSTTSETKDPWTGIITKRTYAPDPLLVSNYRYSLEMCYARLKDPATKPFVQDIFNTFIENKKDDSDYNKCDRILSGHYKDWGALNFLRY